ncbi:hypothetical protein EJB05_56775, partial [Eragrostis curvula]
MAASSAAVRVLRRRQAAAPLSQVLLQPLLPPAAYAMPRSALLCAAVGLPDGRRAFPPAQVPSLLRQYSSMGRALLPAPRQQIGSQGLRGREQQRLAFHLLATTDNLPRGRHLPLSLYQVTSLTRYYSSKEVGPPLRLINSQGIVRLLLVASIGYAIWSLYKLGTVWFLLKQLKDIQKKFDMIIKEFCAKCEQAHNLIEVAFDDKAFTLFDQEMDNLFNELAVCEKELDSFAEAALNCHDVWLYELVQKMKELSKDIRQELKELSRTMETLKRIRKEHSKLGLVDF